MTDAYKIVEIDAAGGKMLVRFAKRGDEVTQFYPIVTTRADVINFSREEMRGIGRYLGRIP